MVFGWTPQQLMERVDIEQTTLLMLPLGGKNAAQAGPWRNSLATA